MYSTALAMTVATAVERDESCKTVETVRAWVRWKVGRPIELSRLEIDL